MAMGRLPLSSWCVLAGLAAAHTLSAVAEPVAVPPTAPAATARQATAEPAEPPDHDESGDAAQARSLNLAAQAFFSGPIQRFEIAVDAAGMRSLREQPRVYVPATVKVGTNVYEKVAVHVKGAAGSGRSVDDNPALTLNFKKLVPGRRLSGLDKLHLNNSVQDPSLLNESVASFLYLRAGVPTARSTHAVVSLNGRDLGVYVLKEGYNHSFVRRNFPDPDGNLYDGGFVADVDQELKRDAGEEADAHAGLHALAAAARTEDPKARRDAVAALLDVDRFITMAAIQEFTADWDGYVDNHNNYRLYHNGKTGRFTFVPHGMDQLFGEVDRGIDPGTGGLVSAAVFGVGEWRAQYFERLGALVDGSLDAALKEHLAAVRARVETVLAARPSEDAAARREQMQHQAAQIFERLKSVRRQLAERPKTLQLAAGAAAPIAGWHVREGEGEAQFDASGPDSDELHILARRPGTVGSWRTKSTLPAGRYTFLARIRTARVAAFNSDTMRGGAGIRISGSKPAGRLTGDGGWQEAAFDFELNDPGEVEFVAELRANAGEAWFDAKGFQLRRRP